MKETTLVIVPTYNERDNITRLIDDLLPRYPDIHILVVDDSSPDGTGDLVKMTYQGQPRVHLLSRSQKNGLGRAYLAGFEWGLERGYGWVVEMDADFSHRPEDLGKLLAERKNYDFVVGSRYVRGGTVVNWGLGRRFISKGGSFYSRMILCYPLKDWTGGFNLWSASCLHNLGWKDIESEGYSFQIELKYRAQKRGQRGIEVPIVFEDRRVGQSKMSKKIFTEALYRVWLLRWKVR
jgi:dolichol-phosphate mannosyltransferase